MQVADLTVGDSLELQARNAVLGMLIEREYREQHPSCGVLTPLTMVLLAFGVLKPVDKQLGEPRRSGRPANLLSVLELRSL